MGARLFEYNDHLEKLASRLSHELRTPIAIVRSSLDNLLLNCQSEEEKEIIERALQGNLRLSEIISRMRQASGVKEAMQTAEKEDVDIVEFMQQLISGYSQSFKSHKFELICNLKGESNKGLGIKLYSLSPDLFAEMLDKLVVNAMEFSDGKDSIKIRLTRAKERLVISVENCGPAILKKNRRKIFHSLVSIRDNNQSTGTNLGLGLYVVRLIAEFHGAKVKVDNLENDSGVIFFIIRHFFTCTDNMPVSNTAITLFCSYIKRSPENKRESQNIVDLVGVV
ncbi:MAG: ATP-binding protein [Kangiellaceae bacterium]|nr:ATP-binding protein [Kangiellaceae bacterium]